MKILVTGAAGFIGFHLCQRLINIGNIVIGYDNLNSYYDVNLKKARLKVLDNIELKAKGKWIFIKGNLEDINLLKDVFNDKKPDIVINLAAQAGVRFSIKSPHSYINSNIIGFMNILECCREFKIEKLVYASSSSVYSGNDKVPFKESDKVDKPINLYAATKKSNELMAYSYSHLYNISSIGLRFFTAYGPWGRPDMAPMLFIKAILNKDPIRLYNSGMMYRDFTYIDDIIESIIRLLSLNSKSNKDNNMNKDFTSGAPHIVLNIGNSKPILILDFVSILEKELGLNAIKEFHPMQPEEAKITMADTTEIEKITNFKPKTSLKDGTKAFVKWYRSFYEV
ncbi:NAD-dependent epimerase/dehydratase family protein [Prochlorococcus sp. MIT 1223]|uniref:NAD-dependent epimerase/dehydratase family protein n=1 Tax=Prochlorococcus sp. MIT 1223 TaxID=3096217 RepID=UPI002A759BF0|nr:NAD-dependent epimerase/dehydratase family protein [Prochlorococcus sp. MIT 1223]